MFNYKYSQENELFIILPEQFQETISGGYSSSVSDIYDVYFQVKNIKSFANNENILDNGENKISNAQKTGYELSEFNIGLNLNGRERGHNSSSNNLNWLDILYGILSNLC
ncbi:hypothetical protein [Dendronalium sp. ChiSLP03b]|uniref:hypothetical protein n=1 Tax=Dendronalium sp. ChiSLP03b TaxID=3075381 RepID=UPI002AD490CF|nr:hypothetical protein [Dendronalium sp. ChiSLP03b]MDZ8204254.1 hypothetical protein [Dendronalium sp. ChiSLP03b]